MTYMEWVPMHKLTYLINSSVGTVSSFSCGGRSSRGHLIIMSSVNSLLRSSLSVALDAIINFCTTVANLIHQTTLNRSDIQNFGG